MEDNIAKDISSIKEETQMDARYLNVYRTRLMRKGVILSPERGKVRFALPRFGKYLARLDEL